MELKINTLACLLFIVYFTNVSSSCLSPTLRSQLSSTKSTVHSLKCYLNQCDSDDDLKKPMKLLLRHTEQVTQDIKLIDSIYHKRQWKRYNGHCYYFSTYGTQWKSAKAQCEEVFYAKLVKIDNKEEERWLQNGVDNRNPIQRNKVNGFWIDMKAKIGKFYWTQDNTKPDFLSFEKGYPQSYDTDSHCVFLTRHKKWHNGPCSTSIQFICESDLCY